MKKNTHPKYYPKAQVLCSCGNSFTLGSTIPKIQVDTCSKCHPHYTGKMRYIDKMGKVDRFLQKREAGQNYKKKTKSKSNQIPEYKSLKDMLTITKIERPSKPKVKKNKK